MAITLRIIREPPGLSGGQEKEERGKMLENLLRQLMLYIRAELTLKKIKEKLKSK